MTTADDAPEVEVRSLADLHNWLRDNHATSGPVWLVTFKKAHADHLPWGDAVGELIAWGWVDSSVRALDAARTGHRIGPRNPASAWSAANKAIVARLRAENRMQPAGEALVTAAEANGMWTFLDDVERLEVPTDLATALGPARATWDGWTRSARREWLEKIKRAKTAPTREKHIAACAAEVRKRT